MNPIFVKVNVLQDEAPQVPFVQLRRRRTTYEENCRRTLAHLSSPLRNHLLPAFGHLRACDFGTDDLKRYRARRLTAGATLTTVTRELEIVSTGFLDDNGQLEPQEALPT